jgi:hypothetical protein
MDRWLAELKEIAFEQFGRQSAGEMWALVAVCIFVVFFLYGKLAAGFTGRGQHSFLVLIPGVLLMAVAVAAVRIFWSSEWVWQLAAALAALLLVVLPLTARVEKASYLSAGVVWGVCLLALAAVLIMERPLVDSFRRGVNKGSLIREQRDFYEELNKK